jgi:tight adherence protein C
MYAVIGVCGLALFYYFMRDEGGELGELPLELTILRKVLYIPSRILVLLLWLIGKVIPFADIKPGSEMGTTIKRQLEAAGIYGVEAQDYISMQAIFPVILAIGSFVFLSLTTKIPIAVNINISALFVVIGAYYPYFKVRQRALLRKEAIFEELPYVVDLLSLAIEAGLDFRKAVERLVEFSEPSPLINELKGFLQELELGTKIEDALHSMAQRVDVLAFLSFVEALIQATRMGVDITPTLHAQAEQMRVTYFQQLEKRANETPILLIFPTILCVFPPVLILLLTPAVTTLYYQLNALQGVIGH